MSSDPKKEKPIRLSLPVFDPNPSVRFASEVLKETKCQGALIGRIAIWAWIKNASEQAFTKEVDIAISRAAQPALRAFLLAKGLQLRELSIGGFNAYDPKASINIDFIDRFGEWGDLSALFQEAIEAASNAEEKVEVGEGSLLLTPTRYLIAMKLGTGERKDEEDARRLLSEAFFEVEALRQIVSKHLGAAGIGRLEAILREIGHPEARKKQNYKDSGES